MAALIDNQAILAALHFSELRTRFLHPFFIRRHHAGQATDALLKASVGTRTHVWESAVASQLYMDELLPHVVQSLFPKHAQSKHRYLRVSNDAQNAFFRNVVVPLREAGSKIERNVAIHVEGSAIEVFLTDYGVGVLSITLTIDAASLRDGAAGAEAVDGATAVDFNYRISMRSAQRAAELTIPHPADNEARWARIPEEQKKEIASPPVPRDPRAIIELGRPGPAVQQIGVTGGRFTLAELVRELLLPLEKADFDLLPIQEGLSVFTVARFGEDVDFQDPQTVKRILPLVAGLANVEESNHAGAVAGELGLPGAILNRRHWAGVGQLGVVHVVADQPDAAFNDQRTLRALHKYFIPYLTALLQRLTLQRLLEEATKLSSARPEDAMAGFSQLRGELLQFAVDGHFIQISSRQALHRFYQLAREGLSISAAWEEIRRAIADLDSMYQAERAQLIARETQQMANRVDQNIGIVAHVQYMVEWIEVFLVSVYSAHLYHMLVEPLVERPEREQAGATSGEGASGVLSWLFHTHAGLSVGVAAVAVLAGFATWLFLKPSRNKPRHGR